MSKTSSKVKQKWNENNYDIIKFYVPIGTKSYVAAEAEARGVSVGQFLRDAVCAYVGWPDWPGPEKNE